MKLGPTGEYPNGQLEAEDDGALQMRISSGVTDKGPLVRLDFGDSPVRWLAMPPDQAVSLGESLIKHGRGLMS